MNCLRPTIILLLTFSFFHKSVAQQYIFAQLKGTPVNTTGWNLQGAAYIGDISSPGNSEIVVCPVNGRSGAIFYNQPINLSLCNKWKAEFDFRMFDGTGADGLAFCFLDVPPAGFVSGSGLGIPSTANGLKVCFDTWNNCILFDPNTVHLDMPKIELRWGPGYDECAQMPTKTNAGSDISFVRGSVYNHAVITYDNGNIGVYVNDSLYLTGFQQFNYTGYLGFTASTGGYSDNHSIKNVVIYTEMPPSEAGAPAAFCPGKTAQLGSANNNNYVYSWSPSTGLNAANISNPVVQLNSTSAITEKHVYYVNTSFKTNAGCASADSVVISVLPRPAVNFLMPDICLNDAVAQFKDSSYTLEPALLPFTYQWHFGDPNATAANPNNAVIANPSHTYSAASNYNVQLTVSNVVGCKDSLTKIFTVNGAIPKAAFTVNNSGGLCSNTPVQIRDASTVNFGKITKVEISWGDSGNVVQLDDHPVPGEVYDHRYPPNQTNAVTNYTIRYVVYSGITCISETTKSIIVLASPHVVFNPLPSLCENDAPVIISQAVELNQLPGQFAFTGNGTSSNGSINPQQAGNGTHTIVATFMATNGCVDSAYQNIVIWPVPGANAGADLFILQGGSTVINASATGTDLTYLWTPPTQLNSSSILQPVASPKADITYTLTVTGVGECNVNDTVHVTVLKDPDIPNAFSPNNDGINDSWQIRYLNTYADCTVDVFDRYGAQVFHSTGYAKPWDGTRNGKPLPVGAYYYIINTKKHDKPFTGSVMIVR
jgi:gliding motility-associated-like protein